MPFYILNIQSYMLNISFYIVSTQLYYLLNTFFVYLSYIFAIFLLYICLMEFFVQLLLCGIRGQVKPAPDRPGVKAYTAGKPGISLGKPRILIGNSI